MPKAPCGDITLHYETSGAGAPVLLIAGVGSDHMSWLTVIRKLSARFRVVAFDNRGCGRSDSPDAAYSIGQMADDTVRLLDYLEIARCHVVGHSMGGYIAQELAIRHPDRVDRLVLAGTAPVSTVRNNALLIDLLDRLQRTDDFGFWVRQWAFWLFSPLTFKRRSFVETFIRNATAHPHRQAVHGFKRQIGAIASFDARKRIQRIRNRTLVLTGEDDHLILPRESEELVRSIPRARSFTLTGVGHCMHFEDPEAFTRTLTRFFRSRIP